MNECLSMTTMMVGWVGETLSSQARPRAANKRLLLLRNAPEPGAAAEPLRRGRGKKRFSIALSAAAPLFLLCPPPQL